MVVNNNAVRLFHPEMKCVNQSLIRGFPKVLVKRNIKIKLIFFCQRCRQKNHLFLEILEQFGHTGFTLVSRDQNFIDPLSVLVYDLQLQVLNTDFVAHVGGAAVFAKEQTNHCSIVVTVVKFIVKVKVFQELNNRELPVGQPGVLVSFSYAVVKIIFSYRIANQRIKNIIQRNDTHCISIFIYYNAVMIFLFPEKLQHFIGVIVFIKVNRLLQVFFQTECFRIVYWEKVLQQYNSEDVIKVI